MLRSLLIYHAHPTRHRRLTRLYAPFIQPGGLAFDVGAHAGNHTRAFLALGARVVAIEPQPRFAALLRRLYGRNPRVTILQTALGAQPGAATLLASTRHPTVSTLNPQWVDEMKRAPSFARVQWDARIPVPVIPLDTLIASHGIPAFTKIDVEGYEPEVLRGLTQPLPALSFEYLPASRAAALALARLAELAPYEYNWFTGETASLQPRWHTSAETAAYLESLPPNAREGNIIARQISSL
jgi:FkbM family methyltransferase